MTHVKNSRRRERAERGLDAAGQARLSLPGGLLRRHDLGAVCDELARRITPEQARHLEAAAMRQGSVAAVASVSTEAADHRPVDAFAQPSSGASVVSGAAAGAAGMPYVRPLTTLLGDPALLTLPALIALLSGGDTALAVFGEAARGQQMIRSAREFARSCIWRDLALAAAQPAGPSGMLALGLLRGEGSALPTAVSTIVEAAWADLTTSIPSLPPEPLGWSALNSLVAPLTADSPRRAPRTAEDEQPCPGEPNEPDRPVAEPRNAESPGRLLERLSALVGPAAIAAERAAAALHAARYPLQADLRTINEAAGLFREVADGLLTVLPPEEWALADFRDAWESAERLSGTRAELTALTGLSGPDWCDEMLEDVRKRARALVEEPSSTEQPDAADLVALANYIRQSTSEVHDHQAETHRLMPVLAGRLPAAWMTLLALAPTRQLTLPAVSAATPAPAGVTAPNDAPLVAGSAAPHTEPAAPVPAGGAAADSDDDAELDHDVALFLLADEPTEPEPSAARTEQAQPMAASRPAPARDGARHRAREIGGGEVADPEGSGHAEPAAVAGVALPGTTREPDAPATSVDGQENMTESSHSGAGDAGVASDSGPVDVTGAPDPVGADAPEGPARCETAVAEAAALRAGRFALAAWIRRAAGDGCAAVRIREAAALASHLTSATNDIAHHCQVLLEGLTLDDFAGDRAGAILTWAVAIRVGLIAPGPQITALIRDLSPFAARGNRLVMDLSEVLAEAAQQGTFIVPEILGSVRDEAETEEQCRSAARLAEDLYRSGPQRKIRYQLATEVWHHLISSNGVVGALCARVALDDPAELDKVRHEVARLRDASTLEREIDEATRQVARGRKRVDYGARDKLRTLVGEAVTAAGTWADLTGRLHLKDGYQDSNSWLVRRINDLRGNVQRFRGPVREQLLLAGSVGNDPLEDAAAEAAQRVLQSAFELLDGQPQPLGGEDIAIVLRGELLLLGDLPVKRLSLEPLVPVGLRTLPSLVTLAEHAPDYAAAFEARAALGDHVGTNEIVRLVRIDNPHLSQELRVRRETYVTNRREELRGMLRALSDRIDSGLRDGLLQYDEWSTLTARFRDLNDPGRFDFDEIPREASALRADLEAHCEQARGNLRVRLRHAVSLVPGVAEVADRINRRIAADDLTTADEFLAQAEAGKELPPEVEEPIGIETFFPQVPDAVSRYLGPTGSHAAGVTELIVAVRNALESANSKIPTRLGDVMAVLGDRGRLTSDRLAAARKALGQLKNLTQGHRSGGRSNTTYLDNVQQVFTALGVESDSVHVLQDAENGSGRLWIRLSDLRFQGAPVLPQFGSLVSPTGRTLRMLLVWSSSEPSQLLDYTRHCPADESVIVLYLGVLGPQQRRELAQTARRRRSVVAVLDIAALLHLLLRQVPDIGQFTGVLAPFTSADPYTPKAAGDVPEEMFFGRDKELDEVLDRHGSCFVYGGRQLGKSALLRAALRRVNATAPDRLVILESIYSIGKQPGSSDQLWNILWSKLADAGVLTGQPPIREAGEAVRRGVLAWIEAGDSRQLLVLLDEADDFLRVDAEERSFANVDLIRKIMEDTGRRAKVVFAGLHSTVRFEKLPNQPLAHFGSPLSIGPLKPRDAHGLLARPLGALGYTFQDSSVPARVLALANNAPALVQLFATALLERMRSVSVAPDAPPSVITRADVDAVWEDRTLMSDFRERFLWTLNLDNRYRVIAYCVARMALNQGAAASAGGRELMETCRGRWPEGFTECTSEEFAGLLGECVELGVLGTDGKRFRLRTPNLLRLLGTREQIEEELDQASEHLQLPRRFEGTSHRAPYGGNPAERSPLTTGQIGRLFEPVNSCFIVTGSDATQIGRVPRALEDAHKDGAVVGKVHRIDCSAAELSKTLLKHPGVGHQVIVVNLLDAGPEEAAEIEEIARTRLSLPQGARAEDTRAVILVTGPRQSHLWTSGPEDDVELVSTHRFDPAGIRLWMWDAELPFQEPRFQSELLERTGAWPLLVHNVVESCLSQAKDRDEAYTRLDAALAETPEEILVRCGVRANRSIAAAWRQLAELGDEEGQDPEFLAELLSETGDPDLEAAVLLADGYRSVRGVVEVLRLLGVLVENDSGLLMTEPLMTALENSVDGRAPQL